MKVLVTWCFMMFYGCSFSFELGLNPIDAGDKPTISHVLDTYNHINETQNACEYLIMYADLVDSDEKAELRYRLALELTKCFYKLYDGVQSIKFLYRAKAIAQSEFSGDKSAEKLAHVYYRLGFKYYDKKKFNEALQFADSSLQILKPLDIKNFDYANSIALKGRIYGENNKQLDTSLALLKVAGAVYKTLGFTKYYFKNIRTQGKMQVLNGKAAMGLPLYLKALNGFEENNNNAYVKGTWLRIFKILLDHPRLENKYSYKGEKLTLISIKKRVQQLIAHRDVIDHKLLKYTLLLDYFDRTKQTDSLIFYQSQLITLQNQIQTVGSSSKIKTVSFYDSLDRKQTAYQKAVAILKAYKISFLLSLFVLIGVMLTFRTLFVKLKQNKKNEKLLLEAELNKLEQHKIILDLELKNKQKDLLLQYATLQKQETILTDIKSKINNNTPANLLKKTLNYNAQQQVYNKEILRIREKVGTHFLKALQEKHLNLTKQDINYCVFLVLDYTTQDMVNVLSSNAKTINQHKYRLKKKLQLHKSDHMPTYLKSFFN